MKHEYLTCDSCGYSNESDGVVVKTYKFDTGNNNWYIGWDSQDLCDDCLVKYKLKNPTIKVREYIQIYEY